MPHKQLKVGDLVLGKENMTKAIDYPIAVVKELTKNIYNEVTGATLMLGKSRRLVKRHVTTLIPLMSSDQNRSDEKTESSCDEAVRSKRKAAIDSRAKTKAIVSQEDI